MSVKMQRLPDIQSMAMEMSYLEPHSTAWAALRHRKIDCNSEKGVKQRAAKKGPYQTDVNCFLIYVTEVRTGWGFFVRQNDIHVRVHRRILRKRNPTFVQVGEEICLKSTNARFTSQWTKGTITSVNSRNHVSVDGMLRHMFVCAQDKQRIGGWDQQYCTRRWSRQNMHELRPILKSRGFTEGVVPSSLVEWLQEKSRCVVRVEVRVSTCWLNEPGCVGGRLRWSLWSMSQTGLNEQTVLNEPGCVGGMVRWWLWSMSQAAVLEAGCVSGCAQWAKLCWR